MATFPRAKSLPVYVYETTTKLDFGRIRTAAKALKALPQRPDNLGFTELLKEGWWFLDEAGPVSVQQWIAFGRRSYSKSIDGVLLQRETAHRCEQWRRDERPDLETVPAEERKRIREEVRDDFMKRTLPKIRETAILIDTQLNRVFLFTSSSAERETLLKLLRELLMDALHTDVQFADVTLETYLARSRPGAVFPADLGRLFTAWVAERALSNPWCKLPLSTGSDAIFGLALDTHLSVQTASEGTIHVSGADEVKLHAHGIVNAEAEGDDEGRIVGLHLKLFAPEEREYAAKLDANGRPLRLTLANPRELGAPENLDAISRDVWIAAQEWAHLYRLITYLWEAFDRERLQEWMDSEPQGQFWPGSAVGPAEWYEMDPTLIDDAKKAPLIDAIVENKEARA